MPQFQYCHTCPINPNTQRRPQMIHFDDGTLKCPVCGCQRHSGIVNEGVTNVESN